MPNAEPAGHAGDERRHQGAGEATHCIPIVALGRLAAARLRATTCGEVIAVFRNSFYIRLGDGVVCLGPPALGLGPLNVLCLLPDGWSCVQRVTSHMTVACAGDSLRIGEREGFDLSGATLWQSPVAAHVSVACLRAGLGRLAASARIGSSGGLGTLVVPLSDPCAQMRQPDDGEPLLRTAAGVIWPLRDWLTSALAGAPDAPPDTAPLIGLGPGLTPSGDDVLCGAMATLHYLGRADIAGRLAQSVLPAAQTGTSLISASYLKCAADGQASAVLFDVLDCLTGGGEAALDDRLAAIGAVGHSSGWDTLAGAAAACAALCAADDDVSPLR